ncbi:hypothetical protein [Microbacterium paraoxydans]|uniref:hypothetical protein n=1 Tax=Microbacterium paraoxydans TaxID=199592 RepID=UPI001CFA63AE|nr:hypothetical protein [Microbacterium paraoxydans]
MSRARWWMIGGAAGVVLVAAGLWIWQTTTRSPTPEDAALSYLRALESGDPAAVEATGIEVSAEALAAFAAATGVIEDGAVTPAHDSGTPDEQATVEVSFVLDGEEHTAELSLTSVDGRWIMDASGLGTVTPSTTIGSFVAFGEQTMPAGEKTALLPAAYTVGPAPVALLDGSSPLVVLPGEETDLTVEAALRPEATVAAQSQLDEYLAACTASSDAPPDGCGIRIPWGTEFRAVSEFRYRVEELPAVTLSEDEFHADGGALVATLVGIGQDGNARTTTYRTQAWGVRGDVSFTAEGLALSVW